MKRILPKLWNWREIVEEIVGWAIRFQEIVGEALALGQVVGEGGVGMGTIGTTGICEADRSSWFGRSYLPKLCMSLYQRCFVSRFLWSLHVHIRVPSCTITLHTCTSTQYVTPPSIPPQTQVQILPKSLQSYAPRRTAPHFHASAHTIYPPPSPLIQPPNGICSDQQSTPALKHTVYSNSPVQGNFTPCRFSCTHFSIMHP